MKTTKHTFFCDNLSDQYLSDEESHHAIRVLRLKVNDLITVIDGKGTSAVCKITELTKKRLSFSAQSTIYSEALQPEIHIGIAPTKSNDRFEYFLEKVTELGVTSVTPLLCSNSERKTIKLERLEKIVMSATKQSGNLYLPAITPLTNFSDFVKESHQFTTCFIAHCEDDNSKNELKNQLGNSKKVCILIGPEGDFTNEEIILAKENKFTAVSLGKTRLRTETAGVIACHTVRLIS